MTFLHPWAIALGVAAAALPFVIHWLTRPRPVRLPFHRTASIKSLLSCGHAGCSHPVSRQPRRARRSNPVFNGRPVSCAPCAGPVA
jgi:hypothetical protein